MSVPLAAVGGPSAPALSLRQLLPRMPGASWEGWFFIAIGRRGQTIRFAKWHLFRGGSARLHPIAAAEGLRGPGELCSFAGTASQVLHLPMPVEPDDITADRHVLSLTVPGRLRLAGDGAGVRLRVDDPAGLSAEVTCRPGGDRLEWARWGGLLSYVGFPGPIEGRLRGFGGDHPLVGQGIVEHAWGASLPFDPLRVRVPWQWDVLASEQEDEPLLAALAIQLPRRPLVRVRGRLPGGATARFDRHAVTYLEVGDACAPRRWLGRMSGPAGELDYEAQAATPAVPAFAGGAFLGFDFTARWRPAGSGERRLEGSGFAEHRLARAGSRRP